MSTGHCRLFTQAINSQQTKFCLKTLFSFFKRKKSSGSKVTPQLSDLDNNPLQDGDIVMSHRYDLGECRIIQSDSGIEYESLASGERVSWVKMIDASTEKQKVNKVLKENGR